MKSSSRKELAVFDFSAEDNLVESTSQRILGKFGKIADADDAVTKYHFLEAFVCGTDAQRTGISDGSCVDVDASESDPKCNNCTSYALDASEGDSAVKESVPGLDTVPVSNSMSCEQNAHVTPDNPELRNLFPDVTSIALGGLSLGIPSAANKQTNFVEPTSDNEPVDVISDVDESMKTSSPSTSTSDFVENEGSLEEPASDHCIGDWEMDNMNTEVIFSPDFVLWGDKYCAEPLLTFSRSCIKFEGSTAFGNKEPFSFEWPVADVTCIESQWCGRVDTVLVKLCVKQMDAVGAGNGLSTSGIVELKFAACDPYWSEKQEQITSLDARYWDLWKIVLDTDMEREEEDFIGQSNIIISKSYFSNFDEPFEDVIYPKGDPDAVSICKRDVELLQPETFINDTIIDFYIKYLKNKIQPEDKHRFHFFNSFFFRKLADLDKNPSSASEGRAAFLRVRKWTRKVNLFEKDYIFIPINFNLHWSLIVICHLGEVINFKDEEIGKSLKVPCILHMDSIKGSHKGLKKLVQSYLWEEWKERQKESSEDVSSKFFNLRFVPLELPQQENSFDCGLFLLHYVELFLEEAPVNFNPFKITKLSYFLNMDWFPPAEASLKRALIQNLIHELIEDPSQKNHPNASIVEPHSSGCPENNDKEIAAECLSERCIPANTISTDQGIEIKLLSTSALEGVQNARDPGFVFREFMEAGASRESLSDGQNHPFDQRAPLQRLNSSMFPIEEDAETGEQFAYQPLGNGVCQSLVENASTACITSSYSFQLEEEEDPNSAPVTSVCGSQNSSEVGVDEQLSSNDFIIPSEKEETEKPRSASPENIGSVTESPTSVSSEKLDTCVVEDSQEVDRLDNGGNESEDPLSSSQENPPSSLHQEHGLAENENMNLTGNDMGQSDENQAPKRPRLMPPVEVERRRCTRSLSKDLHL